MDNAERLSALRVALFPDAKPVKGKPRHSVSSDAVYNLEGALYDLKRTNADAGCVRTIERIMGQLVVARRLLRPED